MGKQLEIAYMLRTQILWEPAPLAFDGHNLPYYKLNFLFHVLKSTFHDLQRTFHVLQCTFHVLQLNLGCWVFGLEGSNALKGLLTKTAVFV